MSSENTDLSHDLLLEPYGRVFFSFSDVSGPETTVFKGRTLYRYMDRIYLPALPSQLDIDAVADLAELRISLRDQVIDNLYTQTVLQSLVKRVSYDRSGLRMIDLGCGDGNVASLLMAMEPRRRPREVVGIEVCRRAAALAHSRLSHNQRGGPLGSALLVRPEERWPLQTEYFDGAVANFVLQFRLSRLEVTELFRVLAPGSVFAYNDYRFDRDPEHFHSMQEELTAAGFDLRTEYVEFSLRGDTCVRMRRHAVVTCIKPCMSR